jgi:hypothetical protein
MKIYFKGREYDLDAKESKNSSYTDDYFHFYTINNNYFIDLNRKIIVENSDNVELDRNAF